MAEATAVKKISLNVPAALVEALQEISATSNVTLTELLCAGLQMVQVGYKAEATGGRIMIVNADGQAVSTLLLPAHGVQQVPLAKSTRFVMEAKNITTNQDPSPTP